MTLHLVFTARGLVACESVRREDDTVVLLGDGVYAAKHAEVGASVFVLDEDSAQRGMDASVVTTIDYDGLVALCVEHTPIMSWKD